MGEAGVLEGFFEAGDAELLDAAVAHDDVGLAVVAGRIPREVRIGGDGDAARVDGFAVEEEVVIAGEEGLGVGLAGVGGEEVADVTGCELCPIGGSGACCVRGAMEDCGIGDFVGEGGEEGDEIVRCGIFTHGGDFGGEAVVVVGGEDALGEADVFEVIDAGLPEVFLLCAAGGIGDGEE